jgi:hypothetical protein
MIIVQLNSSTNNSNTKQPYSRIAPPSKLHLIKQNVNTLQPPQIPPHATRWADRPYHRFKPYHTSSLLRRRRRTWRSRHPANPPISTCLLLITSHKNNRIERRKNGKREKGKNSPIPHLPEETGLRLHLIEGGSTSRSGGIDGAALLIDQAGESDALRALLVQDVNSWS